ITLMEDKLGKNKRFETDKLLTKTMINNYSKEGLIKPIHGKKYSKEHITQMLLIYQLKGTLSIQEIKAFFDWADGKKTNARQEKTQPMQADNMALESDNDEKTLAEISMSQGEMALAVEEFLQSKNYQRSLLPAQVSCMLEETGCDVTTKEGLFKAVLAISTMSQYLKTMVQKIIDEEILP
ncbi:MAG: DUF1836 domain-containing protein, partial [Oscillospiraceae bacterium]